MTVVSVYYDDPPPYYQVKHADGSERSTIRTRLETLEEHATAEAEAALRAAEERADAAAAELLADEARRASGKQQKKGSKSRGRAKKGAVRH